MAPRNHHNDDIPAEILDGISQVLAVAPGANERAAAIRHLVLEIYETVQWVHAPDIANDELLSISPLLTEALKHQQRMAASTTPDRDLLTTEVHTSSVQLAS